MSTAKPTAGADESNEVNEQPAASTRAKKPKSVGFIESSGYEPNWLETGPLTPEMLASAAGERANQTIPSDIESAKEDLEPSTTESKANHSAEPSAANLDNSNITFDDHWDSDEVMISAIPSPTDEEQGVYLDPPPGIAAQGSNPDSQEGKYVDLEEDEWLRLSKSFPTTSNPETLPGEKSTNFPDRPRKKRDRVSSFLLITIILLLVAAAVLFFVNPFTRLALASASLARPENSPGVIAPRTADNDWCIRGDFLQSDSSLTRLVDTGTQGDILSGDRVFSLEAVIPRSGTYEWQVVSCEDLTLAYPPAPAWIRTERDNQEVTFIFDSNEREDPLFFPIAYVVSAIDSANQFRVVGSFQEWNSDDTTSDLHRIYSGLYQQVRRIARPGIHQAHIIDSVSQEAVDAYGRATQPIPFSFETSRNSEYVVFLLDTDRGRASVLYDMSPTLSGLAFGQGYRYLSLALAALAGFLITGLLLRQWVLRNRGLWLESGCPSCGEHELMRTARRDSDRMLHYLEIPAYRYRCRNCTWEGMRLSEDGAAVSPGMTITSSDIFHTP
jgi:hypothetical protein